MAQAQSLAQFGQTIKAKHPEYADLPDAEVGSKVLAKYPEYGDMVAPEAKPVAGAGPLGVPQLKAHPDAAMTTAYDTAMTRNAEPGSEVMRPIGNAGRRVGRTLKGLVEGAAHPVGQFDLRGSSLPTYGADMEGAENLAGDVLTGELLHGTARLAAEPAAATLNAMGRGAKSAGRFSSRVAVGAPPPVDNLGADAGAALSENRIVGATPRGLARKVAAIKGPAADARDQILARSQATPVDVRPAVNQPFDDIVAEKTNPVTGAANPGGLRRAHTTRRALTEIQDPDGTLTGTPKATHLTPAELGKFNSNIYDMTDYTAEENSLANRGLKQAGAGVKSLIDKVAPEASTATQNLHNVMGAEDYLKSRITPPTTLHGAFDATARVAKGAATLGGTAVGAGLDAIGSGMKSLGGAIRRTMSPTAPTPPPQASSPVPQRGPTPPALPAPPPSPSPVAPAGAVPPPVNGGGGLPATASPPQYGATAPNLPPSPRPTLNERVATNRTQPTVLPPRGQQVLPDQPGFVAPRGNRRLIAGPDGTIRPEQLRLGTAPAPEVTPAPPQRLPPARPGINTNRAKPTLKAKVQAKAAPPPVPAKSSTVKLIPDQTDIDAWTRLEDEGKARYNFHTHQYEWLGAPR